jgi:NAD-dependent SIR2 family protein deacetylase
MVKCVKTAIFLGAGASAEDGAPLQKDLFRNYFGSQAFRNSYDDMGRELATYFLFMFGIDVDKGRIDNIIFPTFEEALGLIDLAELKKESFREFPLENISQNGYRLSHLRQYLVLAMAKTIADQLGPGGEHHQQLVRKLKKAGLLRDTVILTTNYDILADNALARCFTKQPGKHIDYGVELTSYLGEDDWGHPRSGAIKLFKLHGSLNWLYCPTCNDLTLTPFEKGVTRLITNIAEALCRNCETLTVPVIVPPTFFKNFSNSFLTTVWLRAERALRDVDHLIFCGYSFSDADMHIKYLLKRIQINHQLKKITVVNHFDGKSFQEAKEEEIRYIRFFGASVNYTKLSFRDFTNNPNALLGHK